MESCDPCGHWDLRIPVEKFELSRGIAFRDVFQRPMMAGQKRFREPLTDADFGQRTMGQTIVTRSSGPFFCAVISLPDCSMQGLFRARTV